MKTNIEIRNKPFFLEYTSSAIPIMDELQPLTLEPNSNNSLSTPNLMVRYFNFNKNDTLDDNMEEASSHVFYVVKGSGLTKIKRMRKYIKWNEGDVFTLPYCPGEVSHLSFEDNTTLFTCDDSPLLEYLHSKPRVSRFSVLHYKKEEMLQEIEKFNNEPGSKNRNRNGVLLTNTEMMDEKLNTITHTMWSLMNSIGPKTVQKAHRHNSIAVDLCVDIDKNAEKKEKVYTLMGKELDENNQIIDPIKMVWKKGCTFTTPPGWWHSHHNESNKPAWVFPVQDAGLHTHMRTLNIQFVK